MFFNIKAILIAAAVSLALTTGAYFYGRWDGSAACDARHAEAAAAELQRRMEDGAARATVLESELSTSRDFVRALERQIDDEINSNSIYRDCVLPANGLWLINSAIAGKPAR